MHVYVKPVHQNSHRTTPTFEEIFRQIKTNLTFMGILPGNRRLSVKFNLLLVLILLILIEEITFFVQKMSPENFVQLTGLAPCMCVGALSILKIIPVAFHREKVFHLADKLSNLSREILNNDKNNVLSKDITSLKTLLKHYFLLNSLLISVYNFSTPIYILYHYIITKEEVFPLPYAVIVPFSTEWWPTWTIVYLHSIGCGFICVLYFTTVDGLYFVLTSYVCGIFAVLSNEIGELDNTTQDTLKDIVERHQLVIKLADALEDIFTLPNFFNVLVGSIEICAIGFNLMIGEWSDVPGSILFISSVLLQIFLISLFGEKLIRESTNVGEAAFLCDWHKMNQRSRKIILILMIRSHKPQRLTANNFSVMCYSGFTKIISNSWSYFTILRTIYSSEYNK